MNELVQKRIKDSIETKQKLLSNAQLIQSIERAAMLIIESIKEGGKIIFCGNGGSAADAQHLAAELVGKFYLDRPALPGISLTTNTSILTAVANDYTYDRVFVRQVEAIAKTGDVLVGISTSGNSLNVVEAMKLAKNIGMKTIAFTGETGGKMKDYADVLINVPSTDTPHIQELHIMVG
ncbi:MAG: D-sedoheptulose 7-phosphate isomerase, partial [Candidatus Nitrosotenuis sp.]